VSKLRSCRLFRQLVKTCNKTRVPHLASDCLSGVLGDKTNRRPGRGPFRSHWTTGKQHSFFRHTKTTRRFSRGTRTRNRIGSETQKSNSGIALSRCSEDCLSSIEFIECSNASAAEERAGQARCEPAGSCGRWNQALRISSHHRLQPRPDEECVLQSR
jgi:hypothetical protein